MDKTKELKNAIVSMAVSPVKADKIAIKRLERECGMSAYEIAERLDDLLMQEDMNGKSIPIRPHPNLFACGVRGAAIAALVLLPFNSDKASLAAALGALTALTHETIQRR